MTDLGRTVFLPWDRRPIWLLGRRGLPLRVLLVVGLLLALVSWLRGREEHKAAVRATRASITTAHRATAMFRADHQGQCPRGAEDLAAAGYLRDVPLDAWGRPLRIVCSGLGDGVDVSISSDGPDGEPEGLDRVR